MPLLLNNNNDPLLNGVTTMLQKCPKCNTFNDIDRYEEAFTNSPTGTFHYRCMNQRCDHVYSNVVDKRADVRAKSEVMARASYERQKSMIETDC